MDELKEQYSKLSDNELLVMVYFESSDYTEEAIKIAKSVLSERGLGQPSHGILQQAKNYQIEIKGQKESGRDIFKEKKLKQAIKKRDYYFIGKWLFWFIAVYGVYSGLGVGSGKGKWIELVPFVETIKSEWLFIIEVILNISILGIFPVIFFIIYSLKLSPEQRKERGLSLFMPKYIFFIYVVSLFLFVALVILPRF